MKHARARQASTAASVLEKLAFALGASPVYAMEIRPSQTLLLQLDQDRIGIVRVLSTSVAPPHHAPLIQQLHQMSLRVGGLGPSATEREISRRDHDIVFALPENLPALTKSWYESRSAFRKRVRERTRVLAIKAAEDLLGKIDPRKPLELRQRVHLVLCGDTLLHSTVSGFSLSRLGGKDPRPRFDPDPNRYDPHFYQHFHVLHG